MCDQTGHPVDIQRLIFSGRELRDEQLLCEAGLNDGYTCHLLMRQQPVVAQPVAQPVGAPYQSGHGMPVVVNVMPLDPVAPAPGADDWTRLSTTMRMSRLVRLFSVIDVIFLIIFAVCCMHSHLHISPSHLQLSFWPFFAAALLAMAGYVGARKYHSGYIILYMIYIVAATGFRIWLATISKGVATKVVLLLGAAIELCTSILFCVSHLFLLSHFLFCDRYLVAGSEILQIGSPSVGSRARRYHCTERMIAPPGLCHPAHS